MELGAAQAIIGRENMVIHDFVESVWTGYTSLIRRQALNYRYWLNAVLANMRARGEYHGGFHVSVGEDGHSLYLEDERSTEECGGRAPPPDDNDRREDVVLVPPSTNLS